MLHSALPTVYSVTIWPWHTLRHVCAITEYMARRGHHIGGALGRSWDGRI